MLIKIIYFKVKIFFNIYKDINICTYIYVKEKSKYINDGDRIFFYYLLVNKIESKKVHLLNQKRVLITVV
jgi:hypothetical protein